MGTPDIPALVDDLFRRQWRRIVARLTRLLGPSHLDLAEEVAQEALLRALKLWPFRGVPDDPAAWLFVVAQRIALDALRRARLPQREADNLAHHFAGNTPPLDMPTTRSAIDDDELRLAFLCAHPSLSPEMRAALTLKLVGGFSVAEIARGTLREPATVAQWLVRAKQRLRQSEPAFALPAAADLAARLESVFDALLLMFNEGYEATAGAALARPEICREALRLAELLAAHPVTGLPETRALCALLCFNLARLDGRSDRDGGLLAMADQDRGRWDRQLIERGFEHFAASASGPRLTPTHVMAAIAAEHARAADYAATDWTGIVAHYDMLIALEPSPVHCLNRAVAVMESGRLEFAFAEIERLKHDPFLARFHLLHATRAEALTRLGRRDEAAAALEAALSGTMSAPARRLLAGRLADLRA